MLRQACVDQKFFLNPPISNTDALRHALCALPFAYN
jgi:hypothetical protein